MHTTPSRQPSLLCSLLLLLVANLGHADTATDAATLETVVVTAQKREQSQQDVPLALSVFDSAQLTRDGRTSVAQLAGDVPGFVANEQSVHLPSYAIRGITSDGTSPYEWPRVSVYQNGVDISRSIGASTALYDIEQVEVARGPQGTLFGRAAETGAINIRQQLPQNSDSTALTVGTGSEQRQTASGMHNQVLVEDSLFARAAFFSDHANGVIDNRAGGTLNGIDTQAMRLSLLSLPDDDTEISLITNYQHDRPPGTAFTSFYFPEDDFDEAQLERGSQLGVDRELSDATLNLQQQLNSQWSFTSTSSYRNVDIAESFDGDGFELKVIDFALNFDHEQASQEFRFNYSADALEGFVGTNLFWENSERQSILEYNESAVLQLPVMQGFLRNLTGFPIFAPFTPSDLLTPPNVYTPWPFYATNPAAHEEQFSGVENSNADLFGDLTWHMTEKLDFTAGLRASYEDLSSSIRTPRAASSPTTALLLGQSNFFFTGPANTIEQQANYWGWTGRAVLGYELQPNLHSYAGYNRGRRPHMLVYSQLSNPDELDSETVDSWEAGLKWLSRNQQHRVNAAVFHYRFNHFLTAHTDTDNPLEQQFDDNGEARSNGIELDAQSRLGDWLLYGNLAYIDARIADEDRYAFAGDRFRLSPEWQGALGSEWQAWRGDNLHGTVGANYQFQSRVYFEDNNSGFFGQHSESGYGLLQLHASLAPQHDGWSLRLLVDNALDKEYLSDAGNLGATVGLSTYVPGNPRTWRLLYNQKF